MGSLLDAIGLRRRTTGDLRAALADPDAYPYYLWAGHVWDEETREDRPGMFWIPALFNSHLLGRALVALQARREKEGRPYDRESCVAAMARYHAGLGDEQVALSPWPHSEIDHLAVDDQLATYADLATATGVPWRMLVSSGGKSVHAYPATDRALEVRDEADEALRLEIQRLQIAILAADTQIVNRSRLMRLPAYRDRDRDQAVLHLDLDPGLPPSVVRDRYRGHAIALGMADLDRTVATVRLAEHLGQQARRDEERGQSDVADELREHADKLREMRWDPDPGEIRVAEAMLGRLPVPGPTGSRPTSVGGGSGRIGSSVSADWTGLPPDGRHDSCPWCGRESARILAVTRTRSGQRRAYCFGEGVTRYEGLDDAHAGAPAGDPVDVEALIADLPEADENAPEIDHAPATARESMSKTPTGDPVVDQADAHYRRVSAVEEMALVFGRGVQPRMFTGLLGGLDDESVGDTSNVVDFAGSVLGSKVKDQNSTRKIRETPTSTEDTDENSELIDEALRWYERFGRRTGRCVRGPRIYHAGPMSGPITTAPCWTLECEICGPDRQRATRASTRAVIRTLLAVRSAQRIDDPNWYSVRVVVSCRGGEVPRALGDALARWHVVAPVDRFYLGVATDPAHVAYVVAWRGDAGGHCPASALSRHLIAHGAVGLDNQDRRVALGRLAPSTPEEIAGAVESFIEGVDINAWRDSDRQARTLRGPRPLVSRATAVRDAVLGRGRTRGLPEGHVAVPSYHRADEVREQVESRTRSSVELTGTEGDADREIRLDPAGPVPTLASVYRALRREGWFRVGRRVRAADGRRKDPIGSDADAEGRHWVDQSLPSRLG